MCVASMVRSFMISLTLNQHCTHNCETCPLAHRTFSAFWPVSPTAWYPVSPAVCLSSVASPSNCAAFSFLGVDWPSIGAGISLSDESENSGIGCKSFVVWSTHSPVRSTRTLGASGRKSQTLTHGRVTVMRVRALTGRGSDLSSLGVAGFWLAGGWLAGWLVSGGWATGWGGLGGGTRSGFLATNPPRPAALAWLTVYKK